MMIQSAEVFSLNQDFPPQNSGNNLQQRLTCSICNYRLDKDNTSLLTKFNCNVRSFQDEVFHVWRCPQCRNIHCLEVVDLDLYYSKYPIASAVSSSTLRACFRNTIGRLQKHGFSKSHSFLDYGCGGNGLFVQYLQELGFTQSYGYDPYSSKQQFNDPEILQQAPFDYILLQDVIEHVEDPHSLLKKLDSLLVPGGYILIATSNADNIDLSKPHLAEYYNEVHVPYHLCIYTPEALEKLGNDQRWTMVEFFDRPFHDLMFGMNSRAWNQYVRLLDGSLDVVYEPLKIGKAITSIKFWFYAIFGYWISFRTNMTMMLRKDH
jgi:SAM-dependent methyltransferase